MKTLQNYAQKLSVSALFACLLFLVLATGCNKDDSDSEELKLSSDTLYFYGPGSQELTLSTNSSSTCSFQFIDIPYDVQVNPESGRIEEGETVSVNVTSYQNYSYGIHSEELLIRSSFGRKSVTLLMFPEQYTLYSLPEMILFPGQSTSENLIIKNEGDLSFHYSITTSTDHIHLSSTNGSVAVGKQVEIRVSIDKEDLMSATVDPEIYVTINNETTTIPIAFERKQMLTKDVIDAEYSKTKNIMVYVAADRTLNIYHVDTKTTDAVSLSYIPTCVSISLDGTKAVVGHDAHITYIDLETKQILTENSISCYALDIVLGPNGWAYAFPKRDQWEHIRCIDVTIPNSIEQFHTGNTIYAGAVAKLHPSGKYIYDAENGISSMSIEKFDIQNGAASYLYYLSYSYSAGGDLWFSESGDRIFAKNGNVFKSSEIQELDLMYNGKITLESGSYYSPSIKYLDHLELNKSLYIISKGDSYDDPNKPFVYVFDSDNLIFKSKKPLEPYYVTDSYGESNLYSAEPYFVFANSNGKEIYVLTKAVGSGIVHEWAIQTLNLD